MSADYFLQTGSRYGEQATNWHNNSAGFKKEISELKKEL